MNNWRLLAKFKEEMQFQSKLIKNLNDNSTESPYLRRSNFFNTLYHVSEKQINRVNKLIHKLSTSLQNDVQDLYASYKKQYGIQKTLYQQLISTQANRKSLIEIDIPAFVDVPEDYSNVPIPTIGTGVGLPNEDQSPAVASVQSGLLDQDVQEDYSNIPIPTIGTGAGLPNEDQSPAAAMVQSGLLDQDVQEDYSNIPIPTIGTGVGLPNEDQSPAVASVQSGLLDQDVQEDYSNIPIPTIGRGAGLPNEDQSPAATVVQLGMPAPFYMLTPFGMTPSFGMSTPLSIPTPVSMPTPFAMLTPVNVPSSASAPSPVNALTLVNALDQHVLENDSNIIFSTAAGLPSEDQPPSASAEPSTREALSKSRLSYINKLTVIFQEKERLLKQISSLRKRLGLGEDKNTHTGFPSRGHTFFDRESCQKRKRMLEEPDGDLKKQLRSLAGSYSRNSNMKQLRDELAQLQNIEESIKAQQEKILKSNL